MKKIYLLSILMLLPLLASADVSALQNEGKEPYAVLSDDNTVLTFYYDDQKAARNGMGVGPFTLSYDNNRWNISSGWDAQRESITSVVFDASFAGCTTLTSTTYWFFGLKNLSSITGISNLKTDNVTNMDYMFYSCSSLTSLDVTGFKTDNVTSMCAMFLGCSSLTSLDVTGFKTDNVTNMESLFDRCSNLTSLDVTGFNTENVTTMGSMFSGCSGLTSLDVTGFKTDNVTKMNWMFRGCSGLTSLDVTGFKTDNVTSMCAMFLGCSSLTSLDVTGFKNDNVTDMSWMFSSCSALTSLDLTGFKTDKVTNMDYMFYSCSSLTSLDVTGFNTENVTKMAWMFHSCSSLTSLDLTRFKIDNVSDMLLMFYGCSSLTTIYAGDGWSTAMIQDGELMFEGCASLVGGAGTTYNADHTDHTYAHIDGGASNPGYFTEKSTTEKEDVDEIKITAAGQTTWCSAYDLDFTDVEGLKAYIASGYDRETGTIWLTRVKKVPAKEGILLMGNAGEYKVPHKTTTAYYANLMVGTLEATTIQETDGEYTNYYLSSGDYGVGFYKVNGSVGIKANRAYLPLLKGTTQAGTRFIGLGFEDGAEGTTGISAALNDEGEMMNDKDVYYNLQGQRVESPTKGIFIRNGKKIVIK